MHTSNVNAADKNKKLRYQKNDTKVSENLEEPKSLKCWQNAVCFSCGATAVTSNEDMNGTQWRCQFWKVCEKGSNVTEIITSPTEWSLHIRAAAVEQRIPCVWREWFTLLILSCKDSTGIFYDIWHHGGQIQ